MNKKHIAVSVISDLVTDQRVIRICNTLHGMGFSVTVIARQLKNSLPLAEYLFKAERLHCFFKTGILQYAEFNLRLFWRLLFIKPDYYLGNDLDTLVPNYIISKWRRKHLFYDTHEYFTGVPELRNSPFKRKIWKFIENWIFPRLKTIYTVNESIKETYFTEYGNDISVIKNVPVTTYVKENDIPAAWQNKIILLMQGAGINQGRGGIELMTAMKYLPGNYYWSLLAAEINGKLLKKKEWNGSWKIK